MNIRTYKSHDKQAIIALWRACGLVVPHNDPHRDIERKLADDPEGFLVGEEAGVIVASCMLGYEGHRGWINYLAVVPSAQRGGLATAIMQEAERRLLARGCPKVNLQIRSSNEAVADFYRSLGFVRDDVVSFGKRLIPDE